MALVAVLALWCFMVRTHLMPLLGLVCMMLGAAAVDRIVNTTYVFTPDGNLVVSRGRLARRLVIPVDKIVRVVRCRGRLFVAPHIMIEYGLGRTVFVQPNDFEAFVAEVDRRLPR